MFRRRVTLVGVAFLFACQGAPPRPAVLRVAPAPADSSDVRPTQQRVEARSRLFAAFQRTCYLNSGGVLRCWGADLINGVIGRATRPQVVATAVDSMALGDTHACAVRAGGDVSCWGWDNDGALGVPPVDFCDNESREQPCAKIPTVVGGLPRVTAVAASVNHTCAVTATRAVYCWGSNQFGQLGRRSVDTCDQRLCSRQPGVVEGLDQVTGLALGNGFSCALRADGRVWCWGANDQGELGRGTVDDETHLTPQPVVLPRKAVALESGSDHVCALTAERQVFCWGANTTRQLASASDDLCRCGPCSGTPLLVAGLPSVRELSIVDETSCALGQDGSLWCWGNNWMNGVGIPSSEHCAYECSGRDQAVDCLPSARRVAVVPALSALANGGDHVCGIAENRVLCWGAWFEGQLGFAPRRCRPDMGECVEEPGVVEVE
jgi:alpha-tubulin suppressor-like RCC1 family protein